jgi:hypothetical protein
VSALLHDGERLRNAAEFVEHLRLARRLHEHLGEAFVLERRGREEEAAAVGGLAAPRRVAAE